MSDRPRAPQEPSGPADPRLARAVKGDRAAVREVLNEVAGQVLRAARAVLGPAHPDLEDAVQEALVALVRALPSFRGDSSLGHFANRIAVRQALAVRRRRRAEPPEGEEPEAAEGSTVAPPEAALVQARRWATLRTLLGTLPETQAEALALRFLLGLSLGEIAATTDAPLNTVRSRLRLAREALLLRIESVPGLAEALEVDL